MNDANHALDRLFRAAGSAPTAQPRCMPPALEARVLAAWRNAAVANGPSGAAAAMMASGEELVALLSLFRRGLVLAALAVVITVVICHRPAESSLPAMDSMVLDSVAELSHLP